MIGIQYNSVLVKNFSLNCMDLKMESVQILQVVSNFVLLLTFKKIKYVLILY